MTKKTQVCLANESGAAIAVVHFGAIPGSDVHLIPDILSGFCHR